MENSTGRQTFLVASGWAMAGSVAVQNGSRPPNKPPPTASAGSSPSTHATARLGQSEGPADAKSDH